jgi:hypothetical protein
MAEVTIELCSGLPSFVEAYLDVWLNDGRILLPVERRAGRAAGLSLSPS